jgi:peptide/nickel transport system ATP-binding protein/peptide/nickel transport system permease protein
MRPLLEISNLTIGYGWDPARSLIAVRDVNLTLDDGEVLGIAGESGCGKSTLAQAATGLLEPPGRVISGAILYEGRELSAMSAEELRALRLKEISIVFQASMNALNPVMRIRDQFDDAMEAHGLRSAQERGRLAAEAFDLVKVPRRFLDAYPHQLSGGMRQRALIALAIVLRPKLLVLDEPTTALDVVVQRSIIQSLNELRRELGFAVVFITHDLSLLIEIADRVAIMYAGGVMEEAPARELYTHPGHPYTRALMSAFPPLGGERRRVDGLPGRPPDLRELPPGCPFAPRCTEALEECTRIAPPLVAQNAEHRVVCHLAREGVINDR